MAQESGMDVDAVRQIASKLDNQGESLLHAISSVDSLVTNIEQVWRGQDSSDFAGWWRQQHRPALVQASDAITGLAQSARNNAGAQDLASSQSNGGSTIGIVAAGAGVGVTARAASTRTATVSAPSAARTSVPPPTIAAYNQAYANHDPHLDPNNQGQCATWAVFRREQMGLPLPTGNGNAEAASVGLIDPTQAHVGSLVSVPATADNPFGHVMVVEQVISTDPPHFVVSEMNYDFHGSLSTDSTLVENANGTWSHTVNGEAWNTYPSVQVSK